MTLLLMLYVCNNIPTYLTGIQISGVFHVAGVIPIVPFFDDWVKDVSKNLHKTCLMYKFPPKG